MPGNAVQNGPRNGSRPLNPHRRFADDLTLDRRGALLSAFFYGLCKTASNFPELLEMMVDADLASVQSGVPFTVESSDSALQALVR